LLPVLATISLVLYTLALGASWVHFITESHARCAEHGELVHRDSAHHDSAHHDSAHPETQTSLLPKEQSERHDDPQGVESVPGGDHDHDHCGVSALTTVASDVGQDNTLASGVWSSELAPQLAGDPPSALSVLQFAPKTSPPPENA
jgi:hypothetical protein